MKVFFFALVATSAACASINLANELVEIEKTVPKVAYMMLQDFSILKPNEACFTSIKGQMESTPSFAVRVFYDFMRTTYYMNLIGYDVDPKKQNNVFQEIMMSIKADITATSAQNPGPNGKIGCNYLDLHKRAKEKLKDYCKIDFKAIKDALEVELAPAENFADGCVDQIKKMFDKIQEEHESMTSFKKQYLPEMVPMLNYQFLIFAKNYFAGDKNEQSKYKFVMIYEMMKFEQSRPSSSNTPIDKTAIAAALNAHITTIQKKAAAENPNLGLNSLNNDLNALVAITQNTDAIESTLGTNFINFIRKFIPNLIVLL